MASTMADAQLEKALSLSEGSINKSEEVVIEKSEEVNAGDQEAAEDEPEIKLETAPADFRFPTTNQTRHCFIRYSCIGAKGESATEYDKFAKYYRSLALPW